MPKENYRNFRKGGGCDLWKISECRNQIMGFAALWIILFHSSTIPCIGLKQIQSIGYAGVDIFFVLSGFGLYYAYKKEPGTGEFYRKRMSRILPDYLLVLFLRTLYESQGDIHQITLSFVWHKMYFVLWYIPWILFMYLITPVFIKFFKKNAIQATLAAVIISVLFSFAGTGRSSLYIGLARVPQFFLGFLLGKINEGGIDVPKAKMYIFVPPAIIGYAITIYLYNTYDRQTLAEHGLPWFPLLIATIPMIILLGYLFSRTGMENRLTTKLLHYCGVHSLQIYLLHEFILVIFLNHTKAPVLLSNILTVVITLIGAGGYHKWMTYIKMQLHKLV